MNYARSLAATAAPVPAFAGGSPGPQPGTSPDALMVTEIEAAQMLRLSPRTLQRLRLAGDGPRHVCLTPGGTRIGYAVADLRTWIAARTTEARP